MRIAANVLLYQAGWAACILGAARDMPWVAALAAAFVVGWHLAMAAWPLRELGLVALAAAAGAAFETLLVQSGWVRYAAATPLAWAAPLWMLALWAIFATTLNVSLRALRGRPALAALLGAVGAPLAYAAGARLGALELVATGAALAAIAAGWALLTPLLVGAARRLDGFAPA